MAEDIRALVKKAMESGISPEKVKALMKEGGHSDDEIEAAFSEPVKPKAEPVKKGSSSNMRIILAIVLIAIIAVASIFLWTTKFWEGTAQLSSTISLTGEETNVGSTGETGTTSQVLDDNTIDSLDYVKREIPTEIGHLDAVRVYKGERFEFLGGGHNAAYNYFYEYSIELESLSVSPENSELTATVNIYNPDDSLFARYDAVEEGDIVEINGQFVSLDFVGLDGKKPLIVVPDLMALIGPSLGVGNKAHLKDGSMVELIEVVEETQGEFKGTLKQYTADGTLVKEYTDVTGDDYLGYGGSVRYDISFARFGAFGSDSAIYEVNLIAK